MSKVLSYEILIGCSLPKVLALLALRINLNLERINKVKDNKYPYMLSRNKGKKRLIYILIDSMEEKEFISIVYNP